MQTSTKMILAICCIGAVAVETLTPVFAQRHRTWNGCARGWMVQGGRCASYQWGGGPYWGGGWNTVGGCLPGYTRQAGNCAPYRWVNEETANFGGNEARRIAVIGL